MDGAPVTGAEGQDGLFASAVKDGNLIYVKVANTSDSSRDLSFNFTGLKKKDADPAAVQRIVFTSDRLYEDNTLDDPDAIVPVEVPFSGSGRTIGATVPPQSFTVFVFER
jgi:alpha-L-arabinofuranosidase